MIAKIAAAMTIAHFAQAAGHEEIASTTTAAARMNLQKHSFMIPPPSSAMSLYWRMKTLGKPEFQFPQASRTGFRSRDTNVRERQDRDVKSNRAPGGAPRNRSLAWQGPGWGPADRRPV
jgi:hypothetical protein